MAYKNLRKDTIAVSIKPDIEIIKEETDEDVFIPTLEITCLLCKSNTILGVNDVTIKILQESCNHEVFDRLNMYSDLYSRIVFCQRCTDELEKMRDLKIRCVEALSDLLKSSKDFKKEEDEADDFYQDTNLDHYEESSDKSDFEWPEGEGNIESNLSFIDSLSSGGKNDLTKVKTKHKPKEKSKKHTVEPKKSTNKNTQGDKKNKFCSVCETQYHCTQIKHLLAMHGTKRNDLPEAEGSKHGFLIECNECKKMLCDKKTFRAHFILHSKLGKELQCPYCKQKFNDIGKHKYHVQKHETPWFECDLCPHKFDRKERLRFHILSRHLKAKRCRTCNKLFTSNDKFLLHEQEGCTLDPKSAVCDHCGINFRNITELNAHLKHMHSNITVFCPICNESFNTEPKLQYHVKTKHEEPKFSCEFCGKRFCFQRAMRRHIEEIHNPNHQRVTCDICGATVKNERGLFRHKEEVHFSDYKFPCPTCGRAFKTVKMLKKHQYSHLKQKPFNCHICHSGYYMTSSLKDHYFKLHNIQYTSEDVLAVCIRVKIDNNLLVQTN